MMTIEKMLMAHQPFYDSFDQNADSWGCECTKQTGYFTRNEVIHNHIAPLIRQVAEREVIATLQRAFEGTEIDLDTIFKTHKAFQEKK